MPSAGAVDSQTPEGLEVELDEVKEPWMLVVPLRFHNVVFEPTWRPQPSNGSPGVKKSPSMFPVQPFWSRSITKPSPLLSFLWYPDGGVTELSEPKEPFGRAPASAWVFDKNKLFEMICES